MNICLLGPANDSMCIYLLLILNAKKAVPNSFIQITLPTLYSQLIFCLKYQEVIKFLIVC